MSAPSKGEQDDNPATSKIKIKVASSKLLLAGRAGDESCAAMWASSRGKT
jgi:hypothetical protein